MYQALQGVHNILSRFYFGGGGGIFANPPLKKMKLPILLANKFINIFSIVFPSSFLKKPVKYLNHIIVVTLYGN